MKTLTTVLAATVLLSTAPAAFADDHVGTITQMDGQAKLLIFAGKNLAGPPPHVLFEDEYYTERDAKVGEKLPANSILRTAPSSQVRLVYDNGDQFNVGPATAYKVQVAANTEVKLMYGKIRAVVSKTGPRNKLTIRTRTATMGVRGTDFAVTDRVNSGTEINVLRGAVSVKAGNDEKSKAKPIELKSGFTAAVPAPVAPPPAADKKANKAAAPTVEVAPVQVRQTTQQDLVAIQKVSEIKKAAIAEENNAEVKKLEEKAKEAVVKEIKTYDPKLFAQLEKAPAKTASDLNNLVVTTQAKVAPKGPEKPDDSMLDEQEVQTYDKYFKIVD